jgi:hypothetical protein
MSITDTQKVDYLFKKLGFGVTKTDTNSIKVAANESIASPLLIRGDKVWQVSSSIPAVKPSSTSSVVSIYSGATTVECSADITASTSRTWKTLLTDWIPPEFGSTYLANVYVHTSGDATNAASAGTKLFITGSGNNDEWFFDYQSGILHFIGTNLPNGINFTGNSIYIEGARYIGPFGVGLVEGEDAFLGNLLVQDTTISSINTNDSIILDPNGSGQLVIVGTNAVTIPSGTSVQRPAGTVGDIRVNTSTGNFEYYDGTEWNAIIPSVNVATLDTYSGDNSTTIFTLSESSTSIGTIVTLNGILQSPGNAYSVSGTTLTFTEAPKVTDDIEVRYIAQSYSPGSRIEDSDTSIQLDDSAGTITTKINNTTLIILDSDGNLYPGTATQDLGTVTDPWQNVYTQDLNLSNEKSVDGNSVDGTKGNWTIQEGEDHLYIINNKSGKKYRFALEEIQ